MFISTIKDLNSGFAIDYTQAADSHKKIKAAFICVDFPNVKAENSKYPQPKFFYEILAEDGLKVFNEISYGKLDMEVTLFDKWFTMPKNDDEYNMGRVITAEIHRNYIKDAMDISCKEVNYSDYDVLYIAPVNGSAVPFSPTMVNYSNPIECASGKIGLAVTFGADMYSRKGKLFAHENGHIMGLPDLYTYDVTKGAQDAFSHCGTWDLMGWIEGIAPDFLAYSKWRLGWIDENQVAKVEQTGEYQLTPVETKDGLKLAIAPLDEYSGYAVEYRQPIGLDANLPSDGIIVYKIDGKIASGAGCITIIPPKKEDYLKISRDKIDGLFQTGDSISVDGIKITYLGNGKVAFER